MITKLAILAGDTPPERFRLFVAGVNETEKGSFIFDDEAARAVMAAYEAWGVDCMIDLEHQALEPGIPADPTAKDARGWARLELAPDGSLWAVDVRWTPDGAARLTEKRQRYVSPAFEIDPETNRVIKIINVAITALPATHNTPALIAASLNGKPGMLSLDQVKAALDALIAGDAEKASELLKDMIAEAAATPTEGDPAAPAPDAPAEEMAAPPADPNAPPAPDAPAADDKEEDEEEEQAATVVASRLMKLTSSSNLSDALANVETWRKSHIALESERVKLAAERATLESAERKKLCAELVTLGAEFPSTVWADDKSTTLKPRWQKLSIDDLRSHVTDQRAARGKAKSAAKTPIVETNAGDKEFQTPNGPVTLSASELQVCQETGAKPEVYAANKAIRLAQKSR